MQLPFGDPEARNSAVSPLRSFQTLAPEEVRSSLLSDVSTGTSDRLHLPFGDPEARNSAVSPLRSFQTLAPEENNHRRRHLYSATIGTIIGTIYSATISNV
jgi:hypothetical protein